jgi:hypothetical protein
LPHARRRSDHSSAFATRPSDRLPGHSPNAPFSRGVPLPVRPQRGLVGRCRSSLVHRPTALMGFQITLRRFTPSDGWTSFSGASCSTRLNKSGFFADPLAFHGISAGPGPRVVSRLLSAPIDFRRGDRPPVGNHAICKSDRPGISMAFDFWASTPVCGPFSWRS